MSIIKSNRDIKKHEKYVKHKIRETDVRKLYDRLDMKELLFEDYKNKFESKEYNRVIGPNNISHEKLFKDKYDLDAFANQFELNNLRIDVEKMKQYYPKEWIDSLEAYNLNFLSYTILQFFENECDRYIKLKSEDDKFKINIAYSSKITSSEQLNKIIYHIYNILRWMIKLDNKKIDVLRLDIILCPFNKTFTYKHREDEYEKYPWLEWTRKMKDDSMRPFNINTGISWVGINHIVLFRLDELFKVLFHELIHSLKYDFDNVRDCNKKSCERVFKSDLNLNVGDSYPILINEAYTEYMAILCWDYYLASYYMTQHRVINDKFKLFYHMIEREQINSAIMCTKLFNYYKIKNLDILKKDNKIEQKTNAFSYILIKYFLLCNTVGIFENKSAKKLNELLIASLNNINEYNYLLKILLDEYYDLKLSLYHLKI